MNYVVGRAVLDEKVSCLITYAVAGSLFGGDLKISNLVIVGINPFPCKFCISVPPENVRKPDIFRGYRKEDCLEIG